MSEIRLSGKEVAFSSVSQMPIGKLSIAGAYDESLAPINIPFVD